MGRTLGYDKARSRAVRVRSEASDNLVNGLDGASTLLKCDEPGAFLTV